jgi:hypothetical protein
MGYGLWFRIYGLWFMIYSFRGKGLACRVSGVRV